MKEENNKDVTCDKCYCVSKPIEGRAVHYCPNCYTPLSITHVPLDVTNNNTGAKQ